MMWNSRKLVTRESWKIFGKNGNPAPAFGEQESTVKTHTIKITFCFILYITSFAINMAEKTAKVFIFWHCLGKKKIFLYTAHYFVTIHKWHSILNKRCSPILPPLSSSQPSPFQLGFISFSPADSILFSFSTSYSILLSFSPSYSILFSFSTPYSILFSFSTSY